MTAITATPSSASSCGRGRRGAALLSAILRPEIGGDIEADREPAHRLFAARTQGDVLQHDELRRGLERIDEAPHVAIVAAQRVSRRHFGERAALLVLDG